MFGKKTKTESSAPLPPPAVPSDVTFHVMPQAYHGAASARVTPTARPAMAGAAESSRPHISRRMLLLWGGVAFVMIGGALGLLLLLPAPQEGGVPLNAPTPSVSEEPSSLVPETPSTTDVPPATEETAAEADVSEPRTETAADATPVEDTDGDGIPNIEELVYTTNPAVADTDGDGYSDGQEVKNLYNPAGTAPVRLADSSLVTVYVNTAFSYFMLYPKVWTARVGDASEREVSFLAPTGEFIQVVVDDNPERKGLEEWYRAQFSIAEVPADARMMTRAGMVGLWSPDHSAVYLAYRGSIIGIAYNTGGRANINFPATFQMMMESFTPGA